MKQNLKIMMMAVVAMFAFNTVANAQFGLLKGVAGTIKAPLAKEAEYVKFLEPIVNSVEVK